MFCVFALELRVEKHKQIDAQATRVVGSNLSRGTDSSAICTLRFRFRASSVKFDVLFSDVLVSRQSTLHREQSI